MKANRISWFGACLSLWWVGPPLALLFLHLWLLPWVTDCRYYLGKHSAFSDPLIGGAALRACPGRFKLAPCWGWWDCRLGSSIAGSILFWEFSQTSVFSQHASQLVSPCRRVTSEDVCRAAAAFLFWTQLTQKDCLAFSELLKRREKSLYLCFTLGCVIKLDLFPITTLSCISAAHQSSLSPPPGEGAWFQSLFLLLQAVK